jgi:1,2-diacylglycerol 3-beta-galactosyltransferase
LPVIVQQNVWTMAHERYNTQWIAEQGVGLVVRSFSSEIFSAVRELLAPENYARFRKRAAGMRNSAVYEIPELLERILSDSRADNRFRPVSMLPSDLPLFHARSHASRHSSPVI